MTLLLALLLDALFGEPKWLWSRVPHPAVLMGNSVSWLERKLNHGTARKTKGILAMTALGIGALLLGAACAALPGSIAEILIGAVLLAHRSLIDHVRAVADGLRLSRAAGRRAVAMIVGRDTADMDEPAIARAAIESAAENFSDGVIAPLFWFALAGLPGLLLYKITNTADSMIGYRTSRYEAFGWAAARFDDLLNWVPARATAALIALAHLDFSAAHPVAKDARLHRSPNAGWPEAAMARSLGVALSGPRSYDGQMCDFPFVNATGNIAIGAPEIDAAVSALWRAWTLCAAGIALLTLL